ncbi:ABC-2 family transporter protein [Paenibacillus sp. FSL R7-0337]|uniref:ABC transporter permease n=1 Tax=Paenibacillus sp. FSL R7-0337 TaxID=1926588 RepID=UPI00096FC3BA|nr:ABC-2 family transporter protein [Paenibacillus sp. FSL R7-0337]OMF98606.1 hypothetical protein BK147_09500 [Paenibacillus sp. FSL R7-0337]
MKKMIKGFKFYIKLFNVNVRMMLSFKADFYIMMISGVLSELLGIVFIWVLYQRIPNINGWTMWEILFMYAMVFITSGIVSVFFEGTWSVASTINRGDLDRILLRPIPPLVQIFTLNIGANGLSNLLVGTVLLVQALNNSNVIWSPAKILLFIIMFISAIVIRVSVNIAAAATTFWMKSGGNPILTLMMNMLEFSKYPVTIFGKGIQLIIVIIIPFAFVGYSPAVWVFKDNLIMGIFSPLVAVYCLIASNLFFKKGLSRYESSGN